MVKYLFNGKMQIFTHSDFFFGYYTNLQKYYGDNEMFNSCVALGLITICW